MSILTKSQETTRSVTNPHWMECHFTPWLPAPPPPHSISSESPKIRQYPVINPVFFTNFTLEIFNLN